MFDGAWGESATWAHDPDGTEFQHEAWDALVKIPFGETITYGEQAVLLGDKNKSRAVGAANGANPIPIILPCHRVIGADGTLTGYGGGLETKRRLLSLEGVEMQGGFSFDG